MTDCINTRIKRRSRWRNRIAMTAGVTACLFVGSAAQAQVCAPAPAPVPGGGGPPQAGGNPGVGNPGVGLQRSSGGQFNVQGAFQLVNLAQQAVQIRRLYQQQQSGLKGRGQRQRQSKRQTRVPLNGGRTAKGAGNVDRPLSRREKLIARLKQRELERQQKTEQLRARRGKS